jgi:hypothetical protein
LRFRRCCGFLAFVVDGIVASRSDSSEGNAAPLERLLGASMLTLLKSHLKKLRKTYTHPNRVLHYDDLLTLLLICFFNPTVRSLRTLAGASRMPGLTEHLSVEQACRSTISDANRLLDASLLEPLIDDLRKRLPQLPHTDRKLEQLLRQVRAVDGSFFSVAADVEWALRKRKPHSAAQDDRFVRLDLQLCCATGIPTGVEINGKGTSEVSTFRKQITPGMIYVADRGVFSFNYVRDLIAAPADFVLRIKTSPCFESGEQRPLVAADLEAGVLSDQIGQLVPAPVARKKTPSIAAAKPPIGSLRQVIIADPNNPDKPVRLLSNMLDVPAYVLGVIYRWRWQIELFFRWLKVHANFRHLISHSRNGLGIGFHVAVIAVLLMYLHSGQKVSKYAYSLLTMVAMGMGTAADIIPILEDREREKRLERQRRERKKLEKKHP